MCYNVAMKELYNNIEKEYNYWLKRTEDDSKCQEELKDLLNNPDELVDSFYCNLTFGTSGLRGIMGMGTNRINNFVIGRATQGLANYIKANYINSEKVKAKVIIAYDTRHKSKEFALITYKILVANDIEAFIFKEPMPVPILSFAIRDMEADMGIVITASHNPKIYNGYKVYNSSGYQIVGDEPDKILNEINKLDFFPKESSPCKHASFDDKQLKYVEDEVIDRFISNSLNFFEKRNKNDNDKVKIIYTPLNGSGCKFVERALKERGFSQITMVQSQQYADGNFPTCPVPNPEKITAYNEGFVVLDREDGDLIIATDPDCDRIGVAVNNEGMKVLLTGNQLGVLMADYICSHEKEGKKGVIIRSLVSTSLVDKIALAHGMETQVTLTGFKHVGNKITQMEEENRLEDFSFAFEESNGYLFNPFVRDKDGVNGALMVAEMASYYKSQGKTLLDRIEELYEAYEPYYDKTKNFFFEGAQGKETMAIIMKYFRKSVGNFFAGIEITKKIDYFKEKDLNADIIEFHLRDSGKLIIRPSGTEPKLKVYLFGPKDTREIEKEIKNIIAKFYN